MSTVITKFLEYVTIDTQSAEHADCFPSTKKQLVFAAKLADELKRIGAADVRLDQEYGYVTAGIPASPGVDEKAPVIGFIAHMDTSPAVSGANVKPRIVEGYDGCDILLNQEKHIVLKVSENPEIKSYQGKSLIVTDGTTLLGADDKAGIAEIMAMAEYLIGHPEIRHGSIRIGFTPDEEVGSGVDHFDIQAFGADFAYTVDGGGIGELEYENFNAADARLTVSGRSVHPGSAKNKMRNAILLSQEFYSLLPVFENPAATEGYEGFYHLDEISGNVEQVKADYIIRDHDSEKFHQKKKTFQKAADYLNDKYGEVIFVVEIRDSYYNMKEKILPHKHLIENAERAMEMEGITPVISPIRGGTDGARLSYEGLPCPNICTGGHNFHGRFEYICVESMESVVRILLNIAELYSKPR